MTFQSSTFSSAGNEAANPALQAPEPVFTFTASRLGRRARPAAGLQGRLIWCQPSDGQPPEASARVVPQAAVPLTLTFPL